MRYYQQEKKSLSNITGLKHANRWKRHFGIWDEIEREDRFLKKQLNATAPGLIDQLPNEEIQM